MFDRVRVRKRVEVKLQARSGDVNFGFGMFPLTAALSVGSWSMLGENNLEFYHLAKKFQENLRMIPTEHASMAV